MDTPAGSVIERYASIEPSDFRRTLESDWTAIDAIRGTVVELVERDQLQPLVGLGIMACATSQVFGWAAFHGQPTPVDLFSALSPARA